MKQGFRQSMAWLHTWSGLVVGWVLLFIFVTGTAGYYMHEINRWMRPELPLHSPLPQAATDKNKLAALALSQLETLAPEAQAWIIHFPHAAHAPHRGWQPFAIEWRSAGGRGQRNTGAEMALDPETGALIADPPARETGGGRLLNRMHYVLHYVARDTGMLIVGGCTILMLLALVTGIITHKRIFKDFFTLRRGKGARSWMDAHNVLSVMALPFFLMITYSGLVIYAAQYMPAPILAVYGEDDQANRDFRADLRSQAALSARPAVSIPLADALQAAANAWGDEHIATLTIQQRRGGPPAVVVARTRGDRVRAYEATTLALHAVTGARLDPAVAKPLTLRVNESFRALHEAKFANAPLRALFFLAGLLGCAMIATGLVLWTVKRRRQYTGRFHFGFRLVEALNIATIAGLPAAVAAYFWANRLLPVSMAERAEWEAHVLFLVWGEIFLFACFRQLQKAWVEVLWCSSAAFGLVPVINYFTTDRHLGVTVLAGDWQLAGFDGVMVLLAVVFAVAARRTQRHWGVVYRGVRHPASAVRAEAVGS